MSLATKVTNLRRLLGRIERDFAPAAFANSFGAEDMVLTDLISREFRRIQIFTLDTLRGAELHMLIEGLDDGFTLRGSSRMREISRDPLELVAQACGAHHQYPDGFMLFLGTMFSPIEDRDAAGAGFTHHLGDRVSIATPPLGMLVNTVQRCDTIPPWTFGVRALYHNLAQRGLLATTE